MRVVTLEEWEAASIEQRHKWLLDKTELDQIGGRIMSWSVMFTDAGAHITGAHRLAVLRAMKGDDV